MNTNSLEHLTPQELYREYYSVSDIKKIHSNLNELDIMNMIKNEVPIRAKKSLDKVDLTRFKDELPIVKKHVTKLLILRNMLAILDSRSTDLATSTEYNKIDATIKKVSTDLSEWIEPEDVELVEETGSYLSIKDIFKLENTTTKKMIDHAQSIVELLRWRPDSKFPSDIIDMNYHKKECAKLKLDPYKTSAKNLEIEKKSQAIFDDYMTDKITQEEMEKKTADLYKEKDND